jgi:hypothetical protein
MRRSKTWGDELTLRAVADALGCVVHVVINPNPNPTLTLTLTPTPTPTPTPTLTLTRCVVHVVTSNKANWYLQARE